METFHNCIVLYDIINILRDKGFNIPIDINIKIQFPKISYLLNNKIKYIDEIKDEIENQLNKIYEHFKF